MLFRMFKLSKLARTYAVNRSIIFALRLAEQAAAPRRAVGTVRVAGSRLHPYLKTAIIFQGPPKDTVSVR